MSVYMIAEINIHDRDEYAKYVAGFRAMLRFDDETEARRWYNSPEYQAAAKFRLRSSKTNLILAKGLR